MAPPLFDGPRLIPCPNCRVHIKRSDTSCLHCGAAVDARGAIGAPARLLPIVMGLLLGGCGDDAGSTTAGDGGGSTAGQTTMNVTSGGVTSSGEASMDNDNDSFADSFGDEAAYGVPTTAGDATGTSGSGDTGTGTGGSDSGTTGDSGTGSGTTGGTSGGTTGATTEDPSSSDGDEVGEPEYGVPMTGGVEPLYGVGINDEAG